MKRVISRTAVLAVALSVATATGTPALAGDPSRDLFAANRLSCAYIQGTTAGFTPQGRVSIKPPLDPNTPGLAIDIVDREKNRAVLEEDDRETAGVFMAAPSGLSVLVRYPAGGATLVTVYPVYAGASDNFLMVSSRHGSAAEPQMSQRYGFCRLGTATAPSPPAPAKPGTGHP
jgi:hypothetical protein